MTDTPVVRTADEAAVCSSSDPDADHDWETSEYDPSVGMTTNGRTCAVCGRFEFVDYEDHGDDY